MGIMRLISFIIIFISSNISAQNITFNIFILHDSENIALMDKLDEAAEFIKENLYPFLNVKKIFAQNREPIAFLTKLCKEYENSVQETEAPHLIFDTTQSTPISKAVKYFTQALALPTVTSTIIKDVDFDPWNNVDENKMSYLLQITSPHNSIIDLFKDLIIRQNMTNFAIFHDSSFGMVETFSKMFHDLGLRNKVIPLESIETMDNSLSGYSRHFSNYFIAATLHNIKTILEIAQSQSLFQDKYSWYAVTTERNMVECMACQNAKIIFMQPFGWISKEHETPNLDFLSNAFYYDLFVWSFLSLRDTSYVKKWKNEEFIKCDNYNGANTPHRKNIDFRQKFQRQEFLPEFLHIPFSMEIKSILFRNGKVDDISHIGQWISHIDNQMELENRHLLKEFVIKEVLKVVVVEQKPFLFSDDSHPKGFNGYLIDMMENIGKYLDVDFTLELASNNTFGDLDDNGNWNGLVKDILDSRADIGLASLPVTSTRDQVIDFTIPYYKSVGSIILMKLFRTETSWSKFIDVMEIEVWLCILGAFFLTSLLVWIFDKYNPDNQTNSRIFSLKESLWFCFLSMTPQGTGDLPSNISGRIIAVVWWLFSFIILASYTANLSAILTVSLLENPIENIDDLEKEFKLQYAVLNGSSTMQYFVRMARIEDLFYEVWENITFDDKNTEIDLSQFSVWTYPVPDRYTTIWTSMLAAGLPETMDEVLYRIRKSRSPTDGFVFIGDATDCRYLELTNCDLQTVGEEFSSKPYAIAVPQGSPLKERLDLAIFELMQNRILEQLETKWWELNLEKMKCGDPENQFDGIGLGNIGGVFILILIGVGTAMITLIIEFYWFKITQQNKRRTHTKNVGPGYSRKKEIA